MLHALRTLALALGLVAAASGALAQKAFVRDDLQASGAQLEERLRREIAAPAAPAAQLIQQAQAQLNRNEGRRALAIANQAVIADPRSAEAWRLLSRAAQAIEPRDYRERWELQERALAAAYVAYQRSGTRPDEAVSLRLLARIFEDRSMWRPALTAYRLSLDAQDHAETRKAFEELREKRGFRLVENKVDADSATPRACFTFSEPLARGRVDFAPYVAVTGNRADTAVVAEEAQLCVEGLRHGERYGVVIRQGLPSAIAGEALLKNADYDIYVRDRAPSVRFTGRNYVLPRTGQQGLPLVSVNTDKVALEIARIGDRNLVNAVQAEDFLSQISRFGLKEITDTRGQKVWSGSMDVKSELNKDVVTAFPAQEALGRLEPGVYVMLATPVTGGAQPQASGDDPDDTSDNGRSAAQWFIVSDLGLTSFSGPDGVHVLVRSLADARPVRNASVQLVARNNEVLGTATTDANGHARFDGALARGRGGLSPGLVTVRAGEDYAFLDMKQSAFDLSDRGVKGRVAPAALDAYVFAERGVYRSGETVHLTTLLRDPGGAAVVGVPLTLVVRRPDGVEYRRAAVADQGGGGRALSVALVGGASTGTWRVQAFADPRGDAVGETTFLVEDYVPERLDAEVKPRRQPLRSGEPAEVDVEARYLYGAPGAELDVGGSVTIRPAARSAIPGLEGYRIGLTDEAVEPVKSDIEEKAVTDSRGRASLAITLNEPETTQPLEAEITLNISEAGGRGINRGVTLPILPKGNVIGVKPLFEDGALGDGATAGFDVVMATGEGRRIERPNAKWTLSRVTRTYQWFFQDGRWNYEAVKSTRRVADGEVALTASAPGRIDARVGWGQYRLEVRADGADSAETAIVFNVGYVTEAKAETPDVLDVALDKQAYAAGETMQIRVNPRFAGQATVAVMGAGLKALQTVDLPQGGATIPVQVDASWGAGAYVVVLAHRPLDQQAQRMPGRAIGLAWASFDRANRTLQVETGAPALIRPRGQLELPVRVAGLRPGEEAFVTVAAVDVGILNLTRYVAPNPTEHFLGQRQLGTDIRDIYGFLIDGMQGARGAFRSGGDAAPPMAGDKPTQEPLARYSGVVKVGADGVARISFDIPAFNGTARVMVAAWSAGKVGQAQSDVIIRDQVVAQATLPRFLSVGDRSRFHVEINNVEGDAGDYALEVAVRGPVVVEAEAARRVLRLQRGQKAEATIPVIAAGAGTAVFDLNLSGGGQTFSQRLSVRVQPSTPAISSRSVRPIPGGGSLTISSDLLNDMIPGSGSVAVAVSPVASLDVPGLLKELDRYPYGCTEQTVSRAMPLLYVNRLASLEHLALDDAAEGRVAAAIEKVLSRQGANGSFGLWSVGGDDLWLDAFVTDFLTRARERGAQVPQVAFGLALDRLRNQVVNAGEVRGEEASGIAYALYVLARNGRPIMGDLRYLADNRLNEFASPLAKGQIGAALALLGDRGRARTAFADAVTGLTAARQEAVSRIDYGSKLRDGGGLLTLLAEANADRPEILKVAAEVEAARNDVRFSSTQEQTWMVLAAQALQREAESFRLTVDGQGRTGALYRAWRASELDGRTIAIGNPGQNAARAIVTVSGAPLDPLPALEQGFRVEREILDLKGQRVNLSELRQNTRYVVKLTITEPRPVFGRVLLVDPLPAGLEIENARIGGDGGTEGFDFLKSDVAPVMTEVRDDRFVAAFERSASQKPQFVIGYVARAVAPGRYIHPSPSIEDMYRPDRFGRGASGLVEVQPRR